MRYETPKDRANEAEVTAALAPIWDCEFTRWPVLGPFDYVAHRGQEPIGLCEIKCRTPAFTDFPVVWIDVHKWWELRAIARACHTRPYLIVRFSDVIAWADLHTVDGTTRVSGRTDRDDELDLALRIPREHFNAIPRP